MTQDIYYVKAFGQVTFQLNGARQKLERGGLYGPISQALVDQVRRTANNQNYQIIEDKGKLVQVKEATLVPSTVRSEIKVSEAYKEDINLIEELLKPVTISLNPSVSSVDKSQLPSVIPVGEEVTSFADYAQEPIVIPETPRLLQDKADKNIEIAKSQAAESKAKVNKAKKAEQVEVVTPEA